MFTLPEIELKLGVKSYIIRFWESNFSQLNPTTGENDETIYSDHDLNVLKWIKYFIYEQDLSLEETMKRVEEELLKSEKKAPSDSGKAVVKEDWDRDDFRVELVHIEAELEKIIQLLKSVL